MKIWRLFLETLLILGICGCGGQAQIPKSKSNITYSQALQKALDDSRQKADVVGASASVITLGEKNWNGVSGMSDPTTKESITPDMFFDIGSIGKNYLATLILELVQEGWISLDDPIDKWLGSYPNVDGGITVRQLLNHTSGIFDFVKNPQSPWQMAYRSTRIWSQEEVLHELVSKPYFLPGTGWHYSTTNYVLIRMIAEKIITTGISSELNKRYFVPLNLRHTVCIDPLGQIPTGVVIANNWLRNRHVDLAPKPQTWTATSPHLIYSNAEDLAKWIHLLYSKEQVIDRTLLDQMRTFHAPTSHGIPIIGLGYSYNLFGIPTTGYGLGVTYIDHEATEKFFGIKGISMCGHGGSSIGYRALAINIPESKTTISLLINDDTDQGLMSIFRAIVKVVNDYTELSM